MIIYLHKSIYVFLYVVVLHVNKPRIPIFYTLHATRLYITWKCTEDVDHGSLAFSVGLRLTTTCRHLYQTCRVHYIFTCQLNCIVWNYVIVPLIILRYTCILKIDAFFSFFLLDQLFSRGGLSPQTTQVKSCVQEVHSANKTQRIRSSNYTCPLKAH